MKNLIRLLLFALATVLSILLYNNLLLATLIAAIISVIGLIVWKAKETKIVFISAAIIGTLSEMIMIYFGAWTYTSPNFINIPTWLFFVWGNAGIFLYELGKEVKKLL